MMRTYSKQMGAKDKATLPRLIIFTLTGARVAAFLAIGLSGSSAYGMPALIDPFTYSDSIPKNECIENDETPKTVKQEIAGKESRSKKRSKLHMKQKPDEEAATMNSVALQQLHSGNAYLALFLMQQAIEPGAFDLESKIRLQSKYIAVYSILRTDRLTFRKNVRWVSRGILSELNREYTKLNREQLDTWKDDFQQHSMLGMLYLKKAEDKHCWDSDLAKAMAESHVEKVVEIANQHECGACILRVASLVAQLYTKENSKTERSIYIKKIVKMGLAETSLDQSVRVGLLLAQSHISEIDGNMKAAFSEAYAALQTAKEFAPAHTADSMSAVNRLLSMQPKEWQAKALKTRQLELVLDEALRFGRDRLWEQMIQLPFNERQQLLADPRWDVSLAAGTQLPVPSYIFHYELNIRNLGLEAERLQLERRASKTAGHKPQFLNQVDIQSLLSTSETVILIGSVQTEFGQESNPYLALDAPGPGAKEWVRRQNFKSRSYYAISISKAGEEFIWLGPVTEIDRYWKRIIGILEQNNSDAMPMAIKAGSLLKGDLPIGKGVKTVYVVPHGIYASIPIGALLRLGHRGAELPRVHVLASARQLYSLKKEVSPRRNGTGVAVFADAIGSTSGINELPNTNRITGGALPYAKQEASSLARLLARSSYFEQAAFSIENFRNAAKKSSILHIATHTIRPSQSNIVGSVPPEEGLVFSSASGQNFPQALSPRVISSMDLRNVSLLTLAACDSGVTLGQNSESWSGLLRSFFAAGVSSTIASLWKVDDQATSVFMQRLYVRVKNGQDIDMAIEDTQNDFRKGIPNRPEWKDPFYWAAWQLVGDWRPIKGL
jgi:hypothetical protein